MIWHFSWWRSQYASQQRSNSNTAAVHTNHQLKQACTNKSWASLWKIQSAHGKRHGSVFQSLGHTASFSGRTLHTLGNINVKNQLGESSWNTYCLTIPLWWHLDDTDCLCLMPSTVLYSSQAAWLCKLLSNRRLSGSHSPLCARLFAYAIAESGTKKPGYLKDLYVTTSQQCAVTIPAHAINILGIDARREATLYTQTVKSAIIQMIRVCYCPSFIQKPSHCCLCLILAEIIKVEWKPVSGQRVNDRFPLRGQSEWECSVTLQCWMPSCRQVKQWLLQRQR